jgi:hypothetical protein
VGRHSSPERTPFVRSVAAWALPWLLIVGVLTIALVVVFDMVGNDPIRTAADGKETQAARTPAEQESETPDDPDEAAAQAEAEAEAPEPESEPKDEENVDERKSEDPKLITAGIEIQVLNGTADPEADDLIADRLARLGYTVVAVSPASVSYGETMVFWTGDAEKIGSLLAERFDWGLDPAPSNLSSEVHLHVVVGEDSL